MRIGHLLSYRRWQARLLMWGAAGAVGAAAVAFAILGMCGFLAGVTQAPFTSFVIVMEMTAQHAMVLPLMLTAAVATAVSKMVSQPLYQTLADRYAVIPEPVVLREHEVAPPTS